MRKSIRNVSSIPFHVVNLNNYKLSGNEIEKISQLIFSENRATNSRRNWSIFQ